MHLKIYLTLLNEQGDVLKTKDLLVISHQWSDLEKAAALAVHDLRHQPRRASGYSK